MSEQNLTCTMFQQNLTYTMFQQKYEIHRDVTLAFDVMFINKIPFVMTTSYDIYFGTAELVKELKNKK